MRLILASASPRRAELLKAAGFQFEIVPADVDERARPGEPASEYVRRVAANKAARVFGQLDHTEGEVPLVLGADTAVVVDGTIMGKPTDADDACRMMRHLAGRTHEVLTGVSVLRGQTEAQHVESTAVTFASMSEEEITWYVATGEGRDRAGAYAIQGLASRFIRRIEGSYTNVVGLPMAAVYAILDRHLSRKSL
jgi:septum formation protein